MIDNPDDIRSLTASWRRHLDAANLAARTIETYSAAVTQLTVYLSAEEHSLRCPEIGREDHEGFNVDQRLTHSASTASNRYRALQQFFCGYFSTVIAFARYLTLEEAAMRAGPFPKTPILSKKRYSRSSRYSARCRLNLTKTDASLRAGWIRVSDLVPGPRQSLRLIVEDLYVPFGPPVALE